MGSGPPPGYVVRAAGVHDAPAIAALITSVDESLGSGPWVTEADILEDFDDPDFDIARDTWIVEDSMHVVGYCELWRARDASAEAVEGQGWVAPTHRGRGIGSFLVDTFEAAALRWAPARRHPVPLRTYFPGGDELARSLFVRRGYVLTRHFWHMRIDLAAVAPEPPALPPGVSVRPLDPETDARALHDLMTRAFAGHWGWTPQTFENFWRRVSARDDFDPDLTLLAQVDGELVGASINVVKLGEGWVNDLGVLKEARGRGIGEALLRHSFALFKRRGLPAVALGVDAGNATGAVRLYERVGMHVIRSFDSYEKELTPRTG